MRAVFIFYYMIFGFMGRGGEGYSCCGSFLAGRESNFDYFTIIKT